MKFKQNKRSHDSYKKEESISSDEIDIKKVGIIQEDVYSVCELLKYLMQNNEQKKVYTILKDFKNKVPDADITFFLDALLPYGNLLFYRYVKGESLDMMNSFHTFDKIFHTMDPALIINLLKFDIIQIEHSAKINNCSMQHIIYMIIQFNEYQEQLINYMFETYNEIVNYIGLAEHMLYNNIINDIIVYLKALLEKNLMIVEYIDFEKVLNSYEHIQKNNQNSILSRSRMINVITLFINICKKDEMMMPDYDEFKKRFRNQYTLSGEIEKLENALDRLSKDCHDHINGMLPWALRS